MPNVPCFNQASRQLPSSLLPSWHQEAISLLDLMNTVALCPSGLAWVKLNYQWELLIVTPLSDLMAERWLRERLDVLVPGVIWSLPSYRMHFVNLEQCTNILAKMDGFNSYLLTNELSLDEAALPYLRASFNTAVIRYLTARIASRVDNNSPLRTVKRLPI